MSSSQEGTNSSASPVVRGEKSGRGRGGGYIPKKMLASPATVQQHPQPSRTPSSEKENSDTTVVVSFAAELMKVPDSAAVAKPKPGKELKFAIPQEVIGDEKKQPKQKEGAEAENKAEKEAEKKAEKEAEKREEGKAKKKEEGKAAAEEEPTILQTEPEHTATGKCCDFCGKTGHASRVCTIFSSSNNPKYQKKDVVCYLCNQKGHVKANCPSKDNFCFYCKMPGHAIADCPRRAQMNAKREKQNNPSPRMINYFFRKNSQPTADGGGGSSGGASNAATLVPYHCDSPISITDDSDDESEEKEKEGGGEEEGSGKEKKEKRRVVVPKPVAASAVKPQVQLRSKLLSSDSEGPLPHSPFAKQPVVLRSESSEEEEREDDEADEEEEEEQKEEKKEELVKEEEGKKEELMKEEEGKKEELMKEEDGSEKSDEQQQLETISVKVDGCIEFDTDSDSYQDCSEGEMGGGDGDKPKRAPEADELYGEHGALMDLEAEKVEN